jgi:glycosyltransferase involved in cell wall biosynthesis
MKPIGGTEILYNNLLKHAGFSWQDRVNLMVSACRPELIDSDRVNVVWQHLAYDQAAVIGMAYPQEFINQVDHFVYVSNWQLNEFKNRFAIEHCNNRVIPNAIDPIEYVSKPQDRIRLIYTSMPNRGLEILLNAFDIINRNDVELVVYSSDIIYGMGYARSVDHEQLFYRCKKHPNIVYKGYAMNQAVRKALQSAHILAYPSIYEETSCLAAIEAGAAGCEIVTTNLGALPETCGPWATMTDYRYGDSLQELSHRYADVLNTAINNYSNQSAQQQSNWFNQRYSWHTRTQQWKDFFNSI